MASYDVFDRGDVTLQFGLTLPSAHVAYRTYDERRGGE